MSTAASSYAHVVGDRFAIKGVTPLTDPEYGWQYAIVEALTFQLDEVREECHFDSIRCWQVGTVELLDGNTPVAIARLSSHHADAHLCIDDPPPPCPMCGAYAWFQGNYGAPGIGSAWQCDNGHDLAKVGGQLFDAREGRQIGTLEDFR